MRSGFDPRAVLSLRAVLRTRGVRLVHTHSSVDSWIASVAAKSLGLPIVRSRHVTIPVSRPRALVYRLADRVITSGDAVKAVLVSAGVPAKNIVAIPPGIDPARFHPGVSGEAVRAELGITGPAVGLVANLRGSKGHRFFLEAARDVRQHVADARFLIVGDGIAFADIKERVRDMGLEDAVIMTGFRRDVPEIMKALDVLVLPSIRSEASSQVIPQALAVGTPVVATTVGGSPELISDGVTGCLVPPADPRALADAILSLLRDPGRAAAMAERGGALVRARYTLDAAMTRTVAVYDELLTARRPREA
jgi:glycosyltransferase involved in cell wall biosynthesis